MPVPLELKLYGIFIGWLFALYGAYYTRQKINGSINDWRLLKFFAFSILILTASNFMDLWLISSIWIVIFIPLIFFLLSIPFHWYERSKLIEQGLTRNLLNLASPNDSISDRIYSAWKKIFVYTLVSLVFAGSAFIILRQIDPSISSNTMWSLMLIIVFLDYCLINDWADLVTCYIAKHRRIK